MIPKIIMTIFATGIGYIGMNALISSMVWQYKTYKEISTENIVIGITIVSFYILSLWAIWVYIQI